MHSFMYLFIHSFTGFDSGDLVYVDAVAGTSAEYTFLDVPIQSIKILDGQIEAIEGSSLWILYEGGNIIVISLFHLFQGYDTDAVYNFKLVESTEVNDFMVLPAFAPLICDPSGNPDSNTTYSIVVGE